MSRRVVHAGVFVMMAASCGDDGGSANVDARPPSPACLEAETYQDLATIESKIFKQSCIFSGCHNGMGTGAGVLDLRETNAHASLVGRASALEPTRQIVVPGDPAKSYLMVMIGHIAPEAADPPAPPPGIELMPQNTGGQLLCVEKRAAIERWITAGAMNN